MTAVEEEKTTILCEIVFRLHREDNDRSTADRTDDEREQHRDHIVMSGDHHRHVTDG